jgi:poly-gamma-glutamate synthesis protein (capsule biosynthesis protein)
MSKKIKILIILLTLLLIFQVGLFLFFNFKTNQITKEIILPATTASTSVTEKSKEEVDAKEVVDLPVHYSYFASKDFFDEAYAQSVGQVKKSENKVYGGIVPHHLIVKDKISAFFEGIKDYDYDRIVLIGPNHFLRGNKNIITSQAKWITPYGELEPDLDLIQKIETLSSAQIDEEPFYVEHSISGLVSFIKNSWPKAKFVPIILKTKTSEVQLEDLSKLLLENTDLEKTLVLASVDFSHYQPILVADFHDQKSNKVIENFDFNQINNLEIDSPESIFTLLKYLSFAEAQKSELVFSTNSGRLINKPDEPTTSHNFFYFTKGEKKELQINSFLFFGDMMLDRHVKPVIEKNGLNYILEKIAGGENRFFQGIDLISANLEGAVTSNGDHYNPIKAYDFAFVPKTVSEFKKYNFNFFNLANNHLLDQGSKGLEETKINLQTLDLNYSGCPNGVVGDCSSKLVELDNLKVGMIGLSAVSASLDQDKVKEIITELKKQADLVVANVHWGVEYEHKFNTTQQKFAYFLIDNGVDLIIGHHPHVVQGVEVYKEKLIFYSLGNFIFDQYFSADTQEGLGVGLNIEKINNQKKYYFYLFPFISKSNQLELMKDEDKNNFFKKFLDWSDLDGDYVEVVKKGRLIL